MDFGKGKSPEAIPDRIPHGDFLNLAKTKELTGPETLQARNAEPDFIHTIPFRPTGRIVR